MTMENISKETLSAFVDGELSPDEMDRVAAHLETHPEDHAYVQDLILSNALLARAFDAPMEQPIPERLRAVASGERANAGHAPSGQSRVIAFPRRFARYAAPAGLALAASLAAVLLVGVVSSVMDVPRVAYMFMLWLFVAIQNSAVVARALQPA